ncbi:MAG: APH(3') family aminoglycoside O-phosphotransferase [Thermomicrobiales bacterium]
MITNSTHTGNTVTPPQPPPHLLAGMADWETTVAWSHIADVTTWRLRSPGGAARYLKVARLGWEQSLTAEHERLVWAAGRLPVPPVLAYGRDGEREWLLTAGLAGANATDDGLRADPTRLVALLAAGLRQFHTVSVDDCPFDSRLDVMVESARQRVTAGLVDAQRDLHRDHGDITPEQALDRLEQLRPQQEDLVVCHGDYCLPNVLIQDGRVSGYVDLGQLGVADRWADLATATWSVTWNLGPGWEDLFLDTYGVQRDAAKLAFYRLLYDLTP